MADDHYPEYEALPLKDGAGWYVVETSKDGVTHEIHCLLKVDDISKRFCFRLRGCLLSRLPFRLWLRFGAPGRQAAAALRIGFIILTHAPWLHPTNGRAFMVV